MWCFCGDAADDEELTPALAPPALADEPLVTAVLTDSAPALDRPYSAGFLSRLAVPICYAFTAVLMAIGIVAAVTWAPGAAPQRFAHGAVVRPSAGPGPGAVNGETISGEPKLDPYSRGDQ